MKKDFSLNKTFIRSYSRVAWLIVLGLVLLFIDFVTKAYVFNVLPFYANCSEMNCPAIPVFYDFAGIDFVISLAMNKGAAWGMFADFQHILLAIRIIAIFCMFIYLFFLNHNPRVDVPFILIIAGALGNVIDFFLYGFVVDFLYFNLWGYHFPVFNFADTCITIGVVSLCLVSLFGRKNKKLYAR